MWLILLQLLCNLVSFKNVSEDFNILALRLSKKNCYASALLGEMKGKKVLPEHIPQLMQIENCLYVLLFSGL